MKMKTKLFVTLIFLALGVMTGLPAQSAPVAPTVVEISVNDAMKYSVTKIEAHPGQILTVRLKNNGTMPKTVMGHNWVLLNAGVDPDAYATAAASAIAELYEPKARASDVLAAIKLLGAKQSGEVTFTCPTTPGTYNFLCTFPAHATLGMKGVLIIK